MRWYCVHPSLPQQAELRIRAAPDSNAAERARICQGRAIAACSPVFHVPGDSVDVDTIAWLQVAYQDVESGNTEGGFVMAALPDGTDLVTPWESTDFSGCCEVVDSAALLFDGPEEMAKCLGAVSGVNFLYCIVEENDNRVRLFHPDMESVWIEKKNLQMVCTRLKHEGCSTLHTFYELNESLPEEAQIAIREFPSKEAQTVGLLSRGETLEVIVRGGNWLQIAGGSVDKAWVMWRTDALELLQEAPDVCSSTCKSIEKSTADTVDDKNLAGQADWRGTQVEPSSSDQIVDETTSSSPIIPGIDEIAARGLDHESDVATAASTMTLVADEFHAASTTEEDAINTEPGELPPGWDNRSIRPALIGTDDSVSVCDTLVAAAVDEDETTTAAEVAHDTIVDHVELDQVRQAWDDRPIRPAASKSTTAELDTSVCDTDNTDSVVVECSQRETHEVDNEAAVLANGVESERVQTVPDHDTESNSAVIEDQAELIVVEHFANSDPAAMDKREEFVQTTPDHGTDADSSAINDAEGVEFVQIAPDHDNDVDSPTTNDTEEVQLVHAISDLDTGMDPTIIDDAMDVEFGDAAANHNTDSELGVVDNVEEAQLVQTTPDQDIDTGSSAIDDAEEIERVKPTPDHNVDIDTAVIDDTRDMEFVKTTSDLDANIDSANIDSSVVNATEEAELALNHDTNIDIAAINDAAEAGCVESAPYHDQDIESEEVEFVETASAPDRSTVGDSAVMDNAEEAEDMHTAPDLDTESKFSVNGDSETVTLVKSARAEEMGLVQTASSWSNRLVEGFPNENNSRDKLRGADGAGEKSLAMGDDTLAFPRHHTTNDCLSALNERSAEYSGVGISKAQDRPCQQPMNPLTAFERRYAESETTSGSENGEIALLGALEDVFDPVDELLPAMDEVVEEFSDGRPCSLSLTKKDIPLTHDDNFIKEKGRLCDCGGALHSTCHPAQEQPMVGNSGQPNGISFLEKFGTVKYFERKQLIYPVSDKLSLAMFNADQDDADLVFEVLVGDDPLSDDWFHDIASKKIVENLSAAMSNRHAQMMSLSLSKEGGPLLRADSKDTYALIMSGAAPEVILESELLDDDDGNYDLVSSFRYPVSKRRIERRGSNSSLSFQHSNPLSEDVSASAKTVTVARTTTPPASPQWTPPPTTTSSNSKLVQRKSIGAPNISTNPPGVLVRPRSFVQTSAMSRTASATPTPSRLAHPALSGVPSSRPPGSLLQRRSFLPTPSPPKVSNTSTRVDSIPKAAESSGLPIPRKSFGFRRPSSLQKK